MILGDRLGRVRFMQLLCIIVTVGVVMQTAAVNVGMLIAGRAVAGIAVGYDTLLILWQRKAYKHQRNVCNRAHISLRDQRNRMCEA